MFEKYLTKTGKLSCKQPQDIKNQWYIQKFREAHGDRYDYSLVMYTTARGTIQVICPEHGLFSPTAQNHQSGRGCPQCQGNKQKDTKQCVEDFKKVHGGIYDYSKVEYKTSKEKVEIICKEHGSFLQTPSHHLNGVGCPICQGTKKKDTKQCIEDFKKVHDDTYDYSKIEYVGQLEKVEILCKEHGSFFQRPNDHLQGVGCPKCQGHNQNTLYILRCLDTRLTKIGITNNLKQRLANLGGNLEYLYHVNLENPRQLESWLHTKYRQYQVFNPNVRSGGTEFFQLSEAQVDELIQELK